MPLLQDILSALSCSPALACLAEIYLAQMRVSMQSEEAAGGRDIGRLAAKCFEGLMICDPVRRKYWKFRLRVLLKELQKVGSTI